MRLNAGFLLRYVARHGYREERVIISRRPDTIQIFFLILKIR